MFRLAETPNMQKHCATLKKNTENWQMQLKEKKEHKTSESC